MMKRWLGWFVALLAALCLWLPALAEEGVLRLPDSTIEVAREAFYGDQSITKVVVPEGTLRIGPLAFAQTGLTEITLPESLVEIADDAFKDCPAKLSINAKPRSYAWRWACRKELIPFVKITRQTTISGISYPFWDKAFASLGERVNFSVRADNAVGYQWWYTSDAGQSWNPVEGANASDYKLTVDGDNTDYVYRCAVTGQLGDVVYSNGARIRLNASSLELVDMSTEMLVESTVTLRPYETYRVDYRLSPASAVNPWVTWKSSDGTVASVNNGEITAYKEGTAKITATWSSATDKIEKSFDVQVVAGEPVNATDLPETELSRYLGVHYSEVADALGITLSGDSAPRTFTYTKTAEGSNVTDVKIGFWVGSRSSAENRELVDAIQIQTDRLGVYTLYGLSNGMLADVAEEILVADGRENMDDETVYVFEKWDSDTSSYSTVGYSVRKDSATGARVIYNLNMAMIDPPATTLAKRRVRLEDDIRTAGGLKTMEVGETADLSADVLINGAVSGEGVTWSSLDTAVAEIDPETGHLQAKGVGVTGITAACKADSGIYERILLYVSEAGVDQNVGKRFDVLSLLGKDANQAVGESLGGNANWLHFKEAPDPNTGNCLLNDQYHFVENGIEGVNQAFNLELGSSSNVAGSKIDYFNLNYDRGNWYRVESVYIGMALDVADKALGYLDWAQDEEYYDVDGLYHKEFHIYRKSDGANGEYILYLHSDGGEKVESIHGEWLDAAHRDREAAVDGPDADGVVTCRALLVCERDFPGANLKDVGMNVTTATVRSILENRHAPNGGDWETIQIRENLTSGDLEPEIKNVLGGADDDDISLFYINTHGTTTSAGPEAGGLSTKGGGIRLEALAGYLSGVKGRVIVVLDVCGTGSAMLSASEEASAAAAPEALAASALNAFIEADVPLISEGEVISRSGEFRVPNKFQVIAGAGYHEPSQGNNAKGSFLSVWLSNAVGSSGPMPGDLDDDGALSLLEYREWAAQEGEERGKRDGRTGHVQIYPALSDFVFLME